MPYEELMLRKYAPLIWKKTHFFLKKTGLSASYYQDDVFQEACLAFVSYLRANCLTHETLTHDEKQFICRHIDLYLLEAFQDTDGIGLNRNTRKAYYAGGGKGFESIEHIESKLSKNGKRAELAAACDPSSLFASDVESGNLFTLITVNEWLRNLTADERRIARDLYCSHSIVEIARRSNQSRQNIRTRLKWMRRSFADFVEEYPVA